MNTKKDTAARSKENSDERESHEHVHGPNCNHHHHHHDMLKPILRDTPKIGRNDPCVCGSGKKYKKCCSK